ncbi:MAG: DUF992 domain-containing protein [Pseudomonadota bacterium]
MNKNLLLILSVFALAAGLFVSTSHQVSAERRVAGTLKCDVGEGFSFIVGSKRELYCVYEPSGSERVERYRGKIKKFGLDIGYKKSGIILWEVLAPTSKSRPGVLEGDYVGATAEVTAGAGIGANALVGTNKIMLNPLSVSGSTGLNIAAGVADLELRYTERR